MLRPQNGATNSPPPHTRTIHKTQPEPRRSVERSKHAPTPPTEGGVFHDRNDLRLKIHLLVVLAKTVHLVSQQAPELVRAENP